MKSPNLSERLKEQLDDRNPGSVVRALAEAFAEEYARLQKQLKELYESNFIETGKNQALIGALAAAAGIAVGVHLGRRSCGPS